MEIVSLKYDYCFKEWFSNETVRRYFISDVLDIAVEDIRSVNLGNTFLWKRYRRQKQGILDVLVELNDDTKINIEMQTRFMSCWDKRNLFYLAQMYTEDLKVGEEYGRLKRCVCISLLDFDFTGGEKYHTVYRLRDGDGNEFSDVFEIHIIELGKQLKGTEKVDDWIRLVNARSMEELNMIQARNRGIRAAIEEIKRMSLSKRIRLHYEAYLKERRDAWAIADYEKKQKQKEWDEFRERVQEEVQEESRLNQERIIKESRESAIAEGRKEGREEGRKEGREEGREEGRKEGKTEGRMEGEKRMVLLGQRLMEDNRMEDWKRALEDADYRNQLCEEYHI